MLPLARKQRTTCCYVDCEGLDTSVGTTTIPDEPIINIVMTILFNVTSLEIMLCIIVMSTAHIFIMSAPI